MASHQLVNAPGARGSRRNRPRHATFDFAAARLASSDGEVSVWIVDARGILILPADQSRLGLAFFANGSAELQG